MLVTCHCHSITSEARALTGCVRVPTDSTGKRLQPNGGGTFTAQCRTYKSTILDHASNKL